MAEQVTVRQEASNLYAIIGGVVSAGSLISLVQKMFNVGLAPVLAEFVAYYRKITHYFVDWIVFWLPFQVPAWYKDLYVISCLMMGLYTRAFFRVTRDNDTTRESPWDVPLFLLMIFGLSVPLAGFLVPLLAWGNTRLPNAPNSANLEERAFGLLFFKMLIAMIIATVAFFALNSQL